ncbi:MAG: glycosyltransferase [bacterium]|nr:glycosyltransferase [bacterium]
MPNVLVIQWARLGDLCQTRPLLDSLKKEQESDALWLSYDAQYETVVKRFSEIDQRLPIPLRNVVSTCRTDSMLPESFSLLESLVGRKTFERVINVTNHPAAIRFAQSIKSHLHQGYGFAEETLWASLVRNVSAADASSSPVHIADIWQSGIVNAGRSHIPVNMLGDAPRPNRRGIAIICDAGDRSRDLSPRTIETITHAASPRVDEIVLVGNRKPQSNSVGVLDLRGSTSLPQLLDLLATCEFVIGPDTGALHLAAALGCSVFGLYFNGAVPERTGPYALNSRCVAVEHQDALQATELTAQVVGWLTGHAPTSTATMPIATPFRVDGHLRYVYSEGTGNTLTKDDDLSVIIVECGQVHFADALLQDLAGISLPAVRDVVVVSSGLSGADAQHAARRDNVTSIVSRERLSFAAANNLAVSQAKGRWLLFLNDDCKVTHAAIKSMWNARNERRIIAPELVYWDGDSQSAGIQIDAAGVHECTERIQDDKHIQSIGLAAVSAAAMLCSRQLFETMSGFDARFVNGYEDVDFCLRAREHDALPVVVHAQIVHYRSSSPGRFDFEEANLALLKSRWTEEFTVRGSSAAVRRHSCPFMLLSDHDASEAGPMVRWISPLERLGLKRGVDWEWLSWRDIQSSQVEGLLAGASAIIVFRSLTDRSLINKLEKWKCKVKGTLLHDCDDLLLERFPAGSPRALARTAFEVQVKRLLLLSDICCAPHAELHDMHDVKAPHRIVLPSVPMPEHFTPAEKRSGDGIFRIGFAGGASHAIDFAQVAPALEQLLDENGSVQFYWWGSHPGRLATHPSVRRGGAWQTDYLKHLRRIRRVPIDLWLVPLAESRHNRVRSPLKAFEFLGMKGSALFSAVEPYLSLLKGRADKLLVQQSTKHWHEAMRDAMTDSRTSTDSDARGIVLGALQEKANHLDGYRQTLSLLSISKQPATSWSVECMA